jgi:uncharacterized membrane protein (DUF373 family)
VHVRAVVLIAMLTIVRKLLILDLGGDESGDLFALAAILALGVVYWLFKDREARNQRQIRQSIWRLCSPVAVFCPAT